MTRRRFAAVAASSALLPLAAPWPAAAGPRAASTGAGALAPGRGQEQEEEPAGTEALLDYVRAVYGDRLGGDELEVVREEIASYLRAAQTVRGFPLENGDPPAFEFRAWRAADDT